MNAQANWLAADLAAVDRSKTPWVVVAGHRPWYSSGSVCSACQSAFEAVFIKYEVDLVLSGHFHVYERNAPIKNGTADPNELNNPSSPWYITNGAAGHYVRIHYDTLSPHSLHSNQILGGFHLLSLLYSYPETGNLLIQNFQDGLDSFTLPLESFQRYGLSTNDSIYGVRTNILCPNKQLTRYSGANLLSTTALI
jgi:3',5'-cyclic AMP phosphodiesterase CpdA